MKISILYNEAFGCAATCVKQLPQAGSDRRYFRLSSDNGPTVIATLGEDIAENNAFVKLSRYFREKGANVPEIYAVSEDEREYLQSDLGDTSLFSLLGSDDACYYVEAAMKALPQLQDVNPEIVGNLTGQPDFSRRLIMWDLNYFKYCFLRQTPLVYSESLLEDDFERLASDIMQSVPLLEGFMYRDCQSRNVMIHNGEPWWIDYQSGRRGPCIYDAVSFLWQARAGFTEEFREQMLDVYLKSWAARRTIDIDSIKASVPLFVLLRTLQVLGAYGFRGVIQKRAHFLASISAGIKNLKDAMSHCFDRYPELGRIADALAGNPPFSDSDYEDGRLTVSVTSFSYKKGYPADWSGNGGGFMFDCRALHNPGRYAEYKSLTGRDVEVKNFLEISDEVARFLSNAEGLVFPAVKRYRSRGFTRLQIGFGCTGGQHRSVYCAEKIARLIAEKYHDVRVILTHREQNIKEIFNDKG